MERLRPKRAPDIQNLRDMMAGQLNQGHGEPGSYRGLRILARLEREHKPLTQRPPTILAFRSAGAENFYPRFPWRR